MEPCEIYYLDNNLQIIWGIPNVVCIMQNCLENLLWIGIPLCTENVRPYKQQYNGANSGTFADAAVDTILTSPHSKYSAKSHFLSWPHGKREHGIQGEQEIPLRFQL